MNLKFVNMTQSIMYVRKQGISPENFYGGKQAEQEKIEGLLKENAGCEIFQQPKFMTGLLGPSTTWKIFKKQQDAIDCCLLRRNGLMPFAFEDVNRRRMFLAAHPKVFWAFNFHRFFKNCNTYEIIREYSACKLYLDIEFEYAYNHHRNGERMLNNMLDIINFNLLEFFATKCTINEVLDLDSSSDNKFSHHVIYEIQNVAFQHNYAVGNFVKKICTELKEAFESNLSGDSMKLQTTADKYNLSQNDILELFVTDHKGQMKLLIDEGVYTKNRHFRLLGSSKQSKKIPLKVCKKNNYKPNDSSDLNYFLDSLITYFSWEVNKVLEFEELELFKPLKIEKQPKVSLGRTELPLYPQVDAFINSLISPNGKIRRKVFFSDSFTIVYDIQGFRYCHNIEREHKSNNIKYIVDLESMSFYQKCHDPDCSNFRSNMWCLPYEIRFALESESLLLSDFNGCSEEEILKALEEMERENNFEQSIPDEDLEKIADCAEAVLNTEW